MLQSLFDCEARLTISIKERRDKVFGWLTNLVFQVVLGVEDLQVQIFHVICLEGHCSIEHGEEHHASRPQVCLEALVALVSDNFWSYVSRSSTLLKHDLSGLHLLADSKVANFHISLTVQQNVVQLNVTVQNSLRMNVANALDNLLENYLGSHLVQLLALTHEVEQIAASTQLHYEQNVSRSLKSLVQFYHRRVAQRE